MSEQPALFVIPHKSMPFTLDDLRILNRFANKETILYLALRLFEDDLPESIWSENDIISFCQKVLDDDGYPLIDPKHFMGLLIKLDRKHIISLSNMPSFEWS